MTEDLRVDLGACQSSPEYARVSSPSIVFEPKGFPWGTGDPSNPKRMPPKNKDCLSLGEATLWAITIDPSATYYELANKAHFLYLRQNSPEKAKLLKMVLPNCRSMPQMSIPSFRKPFDLIFHAARTDRWWALGDEFRTLSISQTVARIPHFSEFVLI